MAHRGRLNVLANIVGKSYDQIFTEFEGHVDPSSVQGSGDVKYHLGIKGKYVSPSGADIAHRAGRQPVPPRDRRPDRARHGPRQQDQIEPAGAFPVLPVLIHGDAAFAGQGVVAESLAMSDISGYRVGGTIHLIINNQIGFTTSPQYARSSLYCTDVAKMVQAPIFHVNGDDPEACVRVADLAFEYRQRFHKDVVIDMVCYRRHGHNEGDDPSYTQPLMYKAIAERRSVRKLYVESLVKRGDITLDEAEEALDDFQTKLQVALDETRVAGAADDHRAAKPPRAARRAAARRDRRRASGARPDLRRSSPSTRRASRSTRSSAASSRAARQLYADGEVDWAIAEALAFGSLVLEGTRSASPARTAAAARSASATPR